jgi:threonine synthase
VALSAARSVDLSRGPVIALATAHAAKFGRDVAPVLGFDPDPPRVIRDLGDRAERFEVIGAVAGEALAAVRGFGG